VISIDQSKKALSAFEQDSTLVVIVELSQKSWLVAGVVPGVDRHPLKKFDADENRLFALIGRWKQEADDPCEHAHAALWANGTIFANSSAASRSAINTS
jgi:hypothetical protein